MSEIFHVAIDGPVASGKGTVARELSKRLGVPCLDTGAIYRGVAVHVQENGIENLFKIHIDVKIIDGVTRIYLNNGTGMQDVTDKLRTNEVSRLTAQLATIPQVRMLCTRIAQDIAKRQSIVVEGRDTCNVVLPSAKYKFLLTADLKVRAKRRFDELAARGDAVTLEEVIKQTKQRDKSDQEKGGLKKIPDAITIDATKLTVDEVVVHMLNYISR